MIHINAIVKGEEDIPPITKQFQYDDNSEEIFFSGVEVIKTRLASNLKINLNEALLFYCAYIVSELRSGKSVFEIEKNARRVLSQHNVMVGVPESIQRITFEVNIDNKIKETVKFDEPIPTSDYILAPKIDND